MTLNQFVAREFINTGSEAVKRHFTNKLGIYLRTSSFPSALSESYYEAANNICICKILVFMFKFRH